VRDPNCIFCKVIAGELPGEIVDSDDRTVTVMDINPATRGHVVVIPREHTEDLATVSDEDLVATMHAARRMVERIRETLAPAGFNVLNNMGRAAWQSIFHFHVHVIPRYEDDPLKLPWVPGPGDEEEIATLAAELRQDGEGS
jgi:histidine triad (HIT) family protein